MYRKILVPLEPGEELTHLDYARDVAQQSGAELILLRVVTEDVPFVEKEERVQCEAHGADIWRVDVRYGFSQDPHIPAALAQCPLQGVPFRLTEDLLRCRSMTHWTSPGTWPGDSQRLTSRRSSTGTSSRPIPSSPRMAW